MTIRRALDAMLSGEVDGAVGAPDASLVRSALDEAGFGDVPAELVGTAIGHYADSAALEHADALASLAIEASSVPFDAELDAPVADVDAHDVDPMDELDATEGVESAPDDQPDEAVDEVAVDDELEDAIDFGTGSVDGPAPDTEEAGDPMTELDDFSGIGVTDTFGSSLENALLPKEHDGLEAVVDAFDETDGATESPRYDDLDEDGTDTDPAFDDFDID